MNPQEEEIKRILKKLRAGIGLYDQEIDELENAIKNAPDPYEAW